jgi:hypothetical protein
MGLPWSPPRVLGQTGLCLSPWCAWGGTAGARAAGPSPFRVAVTLPGSTGPVGSRPNREGPCCEQREPHAHRRGDHLASDPLTEVPMDPTNGIGRRATAAVTSALAAATVLAALVVAAPTPAGAAPQQPADPTGAFLLRGGRFTPLGASPAPRWRRRSTSTTAARCRRLPRRPGRRPLLCQGPAGPGDHLRGPRRRRHPCPGASATAARSPAPGATVPGPGPSSSRARGTACVGPRPADPLRRPRVAGHRRARHQQPRAGHRRRRRRRRPPPRVRAAAGPLRHHRRARPDGPDAWASTTAARSSSPSLAPA